MPTLTKRLLLGLGLIMVSLASGCASGNGCREACIFGFGPGNSTFDKIALAADRSDPCQAGTTPERRKELGRPEGYQRPNWCGAGHGYSKPIYIYNNSGQRIATVK